VFGSCVDATLHHFLISGQSLSIGSSSAVVSLEQPYANVSFNSGVRAGKDGLTGLIPLVETQAGNLGETIASGTANLVAELEQARGADHRILASAHGVGGQPYTALKKGTNPFAAGIAQVTAGLDLATLNGDTYAVRAVAIIHGERDHKEGTQTYTEHLLEWQSDYEADVQSVTGQTDPVVMFLCQMSSFTRYNTATSVIHGAQLEAARLRPERIYVVGPKYFLPYTDGVHLSGDGERWLGEFYAKAYRQVLIEGKPWHPVSPRSATREGNVITIDFHVPEPPLVFDEVLVSNPGMLGFEFTDNSGASPEIVDVSLVSETAVQVSLSAPPVGGGRKIRYAFTGTPGEDAGPQTGARGNLRDSDMTPSRHDYPLYNWAVHFEVAVD